MVKLKDIICKVNLKDICKVKLSNKTVDEGILFDSLVKKLEELKGTVFEVNINYKHVQGQSLFSKNYYSLKEVIELLTKEVKPEPEMFYTYSRYRVYSRKKKEDHYVKIIHGYKEKEDKYGRPIWSRPVKTITINFVVNK